MWLRRIWSIEVIDDERGWLYLVSRITLEQDQKAFGDEIRDETLIYYSFLRQKPLFTEHSRVVSLDDDKNQPYLFWQ
jgi:hypothetical protein